MNIHYIQHESFETPGVILDWAAERGYGLSRTLAYSKNGDEAAFPDLSGFDWLVIMGGSMNVYEDSLHPWLGEEKRFIRRAVEAGKTVLGFCLGAQLLAVVLGGKVSRNPEKEIGWFPITLNEEARSRPLFSFLPQRPVVFQRHGDTFSVPPGAVLLAGSKACKHQAFAYGERVYGFQFHLENTRDILVDLVTHCGDELEGNAQGPDEILAHEEYLAQNKRWMRELLSRLEGAGGRA